LGVPIHNNFFILFEQNCKSIDKQTNSSVFNDKLKKVMPVIDLKLPGWESGISYSTSKHILISLTSINYYMST
jgi:hypothetical protein